jgi:hypothetical protein
VKADKTKTCPYHFLKVSLSFLRIISSWARFQWPSGGKGKEIDLAGKTSRQSLFTPLSQYSLPFASSSSSHRPSMGVWQGVAMESLKFHPGLPCPTLLCPAGGLPLEQTSWPFQVWPVCRAGGLRPSFTPLDTSRRAPTGRRFLHSARPFPPRFSFVPNFS